MCIKLSIKQADNKLRFYNILEAMLSITRWCIEYNVSEKAQRLMGKPSHIFSGIPLSCPYDTWYTSKTYVHNLSNSIHQYIIWKYMDIEVLALY